MRIGAALIASLLLGACSFVPTGSGSSEPARSTAAARMPVSPDEQKCLADLGRTGSRFSPLPDRHYGAGCSTLNAVSMSDLRSDLAEIGLSNLGPVTCPTANAFAGWARYGVDRAARQILGSRLVRIETMGSYSCRNVAGSSRRSAHATGDAIDVSGFVLADGRRIVLTNAWDGGTSAEREFLRVVHRSACKRFGTVLGPDYNAAHRDHFHLERSGSGRRGGSFCR